MKKIITTITLMLGAGFAFAVTEVQKTAFSEITKNPLGSNENMQGTVKAKAHIIKPIADWALASPKEYGDWMRSTTTVGVRGTWLLGAYYESQGVASFTELQDFAIFGGRFSFDKAFFDSSAYSSLKGNDFIFDGIKMEDSRIIRLAARYGDLHIMDAYDAGLIADHFDIYLTAVEKSLATVKSTESKKAAWDKYGEIRRKFAPYQANTQVKKNWDRLMADIEGAEYDYQKSL